MADVDIESEKYRWMGSARFDFYVCLPYSPVVINDFSNQQSQGFLSVTGDS